MVDIVNTEAKTLLQDFDFSGDGSEISYTINYLGGSATQESEERPYLTKSKENISLSEDQKKVLEDIKSSDIKKASIFDPSIEEALLKELKRKMNSFIPDVHVAIWIERVTHDYVYYTVDFDTTFYSGYSFDSEGNPTIIDERVEVERKSIFLPVDHNSEHKDPNRLIKNFAHTPDINDPLVWKFRIDSEDYIKASVYALKTNRVDLTEEEKATVIEKVAKAYKEFFPETKELPKVLKSSESNTSGAASGGNIVNDVNKNMPSGINKSEKKIMPEGVVDNKSAEVIDNSDNIQDLMKSMEDMKTLVKASNARAEAAEKKTEEIQKANEAREIAKAKEDLSTVVKSWESVENTEEVVEALFKSSDYATLVKAMQDLQDKVEEVKKSFGEEEHGVDGDIDNSNAIDKSKSAVRDILKKRNSKKS